jgi:16S rRNA (uracil1498-N3)-methyltransferase
MDTSASRSSTGCNPGSRRACPGPVILPSKPPGGVLSRLNNAAHFRAAAPFRPGTPVPAVASRTLRPMTTPRFLVPEALVAGTTIALPASVGHHARRVLRLRDGAAVILFDGSGNEYHAILAADPMNASRSLARIVHGGPVDREAGLAITLIQAISAQEKVDWLVEKCVELGVQRLILAPTARSVVRLDESRRERRIDRWREIAAAACCQCGRNRLPRIEIAPDLGAALAAATDAPSRWILDPTAPSGIGAAAGGPVACAVGPEGGFTDEERDRAGALGYVRARLGPRVLRTETAGLVAVSALLAMHGEYGGAAG